MSDEILSLVSRIERRLDDAVSACRITPHWLTIADAAVYSGMSEKSIRKLLDKGEIIGRRPVPGRILIDRNELDNMIRGSVNSPKVGRGRRRVS